MRPRPGIAQAPEQTTWPRATASSGPAVSGAAMAAPPSASTVSDDSRFVPAPQFESVDDTSVPTSELQAGNGNTSAAAVAAPPSATMASDVTTLVVGKPLQPFHICVPADGDESGACMPAGICRTQSSSSSSSTSSCAERQRRRGTTCKHAVVQNGCKILGTSRSCPYHFPHARKEGQRKSFSWGLVPGGAGAVFAASNAALALVQLGAEADATKEMQVRRADALWQDVLIRPLIELASLNVLVHRGLP